MTGVGIAYGNDADAFALGRSRGLDWTGVLVTLSEEG